MVSVRRGLHGRCRLYAAAERAYPHRHLLRKPLAPDAALDRPFRPCGLRPALLHHHELAPGALHAERLAHRPGLDQRRRAADLARPRHPCRRLHPAGGAGSGRDRQEDRRHPRRDGRPASLCFRPSGGRDGRRATGRHRCADQRGEALMLEFIAVNMAPIMFASLVVFLLLGYSVAFSLAANGLLFFAIGVWLAPWSQNTITLDWALLGTMPQRLWGTMSNETMLAIPFFTFMGIILERSGMAEDLLDTVGQLFGPVRGGLAYAVIIVGA